MTENLTLERLRGLYNVLAGQAVVANRWVPEGQAYLMGEFTKPVGWASMSTKEQVEYGVEHGAIILIRDIGNAPMNGAST